MDTRITLNRNKIHSVIEEMLKILWSRKRYEAKQIILTDKSELCIAADVCHMFIMIYATFNIAVIYQITKREIPESIM